MKWTFWIFPHRTDPSVLKCWEFEISSPFISFFSSLVCQAFLIIFCHTYSSAIEFTLFPLNIHFQDWQTTCMLIGTIFRYRLLVFDSFNFLVEPCQIPIRNFREKIFSLNVSVHQEVTNSMDFRLEMNVGYSYSSMRPTNWDGVKHSISPNCSNPSVNQANRSPIMFDLWACPSLIFVWLFNLWKEFYLARDFIVDSC